MNVSNFIFALYLKSCDYAGIDIFWTLTDTHPLHQAIKMVNRYLSIWEIAHRWRDINPDKTDPADIPLNIQDTIRYICRGALDGYLSLFILVVISPNGENDGSRFRPEIRQYHVNEIPSELEDALYRKYDKNVLSAYFIEAENLFEYCLKEQVIESKLKNSIVDFPNCWSHLNGYSDISKREPDDFETRTVTFPQSLRPMQIDRLVCQAVAKTLWDVYPTMTITAMSKHTAILEYGGGKLYTGKNTLRNWLSEVAPDSVRKPGRPKSNKPNKDAA